MPVASVRGITVGYDDEGSGDALVLVHGHPFDRSMWRPQVERYAGRGWRVVAADLRGYGTTTVVAGTTAFADFARDVVGLADHLGLDRFVLGGLSMGGQIVMEVHRLFASRLRGLVLADTSPVAEDDAGRAARHAAADRLEREGLGPYAEEVLPKMVGGPTRAERPEVARFVLAMMRAAPAAGAAAALRGRADRPDYVAMLATVAVPALVVVGRDDEFTPVDEARGMAERLPDATLAVVDGAAHMPNLEQPDAFHAALDAFLAGLSTS